MKLFVIDCHFAMGILEEEDELIILQSEETPSKKEVEKILERKFYFGTCYVKGIREVKEKDIRYQKTIFIKE